MRISAAILVLVAIGCGQSSVPPGAPTPAALVQFGQERTLYSKTLNEERPYWVYLPSSYPDNGARDLAKYPVLYLLDAEWNFSWVSQVVQFMGESTQIPEMIVIGIPNIDRDKDLTPTHDTTKASSGGGPSFEKFLCEELAPEIDANYRTSPYRILVGHSMGGALAADAFLRQLDGFHGCIAIDPSLWWDKQILVQRAKQFVPPSDSHSSIFIVTADWPPGVDQTGSMIDSSESFVAALKATSSPGMRIGYEHYDSEDHSSSRLRGLCDGLRFLFDGYKPLDILAFDAPDPIEDHFQRLSDRCGFRILPPERFVNKIGYALLNAAEPEKAVECFKLNVRNFPRSPFVYSHLADAYAAKGDRELATANYERALELDPSVDDARKALENLR